MLLFHVGVVWFGLCCIVLFVCWFGLCCSVMFGCLVLLVWYGVCCCLAFALCCCAVLLCSLFVLFRLVFVWSRLVGSGRPGIVLLWMCRVLSGLGLSCPALCCVAVWFDFV